AFASDHVRLRHLRHLGRRLCPAALGYAQGAKPGGTHAAFLDDSGRQLHLCDFPVGRRHHPGTGLAARRTVHSVRDRHAVLLGVARRRRLADAVESRRVCLERLAHDLWNRRPARTGSSPRSRAGQPGMNKLVLIAGGSTLVYAVLALVMGVLPGIELSKTPPGPGVEPLTSLQARGRDVYV